MEDLFYVEIKDFIVGNGNTYYNINSKIMMKKREKAYEEKNYVITGVNSDTCIFNKRLGMLANFFDIRKESTELFKGLEIAEQRDVCSEWMNQFRNAVCDLSRMLTD